MCGAILTPLKEIGNLRISIRSFSRTRHEKKYGVFTISSGMNVADFSTYREALRFVESRRKEEILRMSILLAQFDGYGLSRSHKYTGIAAQIIDLLNRMIGRETA